MGLFSGLWLVGLMTIVPGKALLDLNGTWEVEGTWRASVTLPCAYEPSPDFKEISVVWKTAQQDQGTRTIFHRDATSGDQTLLASFRGRLSVPKEPPGVVSLQIKALEMADVGRYICEVAWETTDKNRVTRDRTTTLRVIKVPVTKPVVQLSSNRAVLSPRTRLNLTCLASGSPPISYEWLKIVPGHAAVQVGAEAVLRFDRLEPSHAGRYYCKARNPVGTPRGLRSDTVQVTVAVPVTKPVVQLSSNRAVLSPGTKLNLTCLASGSPPISYEWFKILPGDAAVQVGAEAVLRLDGLEPSHAGRYYCRARNQVGPPRGLRSDTVQVTVEEMPPTEWTLKARRTTGSAEPRRTTTLTEPVAATEVVLSEKEVPRKASLPLFLVILIALLCAVLVFTAFAVIFFRRRAKDDRSYQVAYHNNSVNAREEGSPDCSGQVTGPCESPYEEPCARAQNNYTEEPARGGGHVPLDETGKPGGADYESLVNKVESEYELLEYK